MPFKLREGRAALEERWTKFRKPKWEQKLSELRKEKTYLEIGLRELAGINFGSRASHRSMEKRLAKVKAAIDELEIKLA